MTLSTAVLLPSPLRNVLTATLEHLGKERPPRQRYRGYLAGSAAQL
jgi:hypothetical protein